MQQRQRPLHRLIIESGLLFLLVALAFLGWVQYIQWYDATIPVAPVPEGSRLLRRNPELVDHQFPYHSAIARYWYYAKYSTPLPYDTVAAFYERKAAAQPFGSFIVEVLPPATTPVTLTYNKGKSEYLALPFDRDRDDPLNETLILVEVSKNPGDYGLDRLQICVFPLALVVGGVIVVARYLHSTQRLARTYLDQDTQI